MRTSSSRRSALGSRLAVESTGFSQVAPAVGISAYQVAGLQAGWGCPTVQGVRPLLRRPREPVLVFEGHQSAVRDAYLRAFDGLRRDATAQHGHGVVGVAVNRRWLPGAQSVLEVTARGSVIRHGESPELEEPFLSVLSSSDFAALLAGGCVPCGVAFGYAVLHAHAFTMWPPGITAVSSPVNQRQWDNVELEGLTTAVQHARRIAEQHLRADLAAHGADGAVGVAVSVELRDSPCAQGPGRLIEVTALGTAVTRFGPAANDIDVRLTFDGASRGTL